MKKCFLNFGATDKQINAQQPNIYKFLITIPARKPSIRKHINKLQYNLWHKLKYTHKKAKYLVTLIKNKIRNKNSIATGNYTRI